MRRSVTVRRAADAASIEVRAGDKVLGTVARLASESDTLMTGAFTHRPAYADFAADFLGLAAASAAGRGDERAQLHARLEAARIGVWHTTHDMRIDRPATLEIADGKVAFAPNDAFTMLRTGGL